MTEELMEEGEEFISGVESEAVEEHAATGESKGPPKPAWDTPTLTLTFPFPGIVRRGSQWITDTDGTRWAIEKLEDRATYPPACGDEDVEKGCGRTTGYIVIPEYKHWLKANPYSAFLFRSHGAGTAAYAIERNAFIPVRICIGCASARDGYRCGKKYPYDQHRQKQQIMNSEELTAKEKEVALNAFNAGFKKGAAAVQEAAGDKDRKKYLPKPGKGG